jgi:3-deoxy-manno-octulosonate cytidylyltransferase (CMP-KDO synthetase)
MTIAIIPSRFGSTRFKGKPLALIDGKPMIQRVYEQAVKSESISMVVVATDDQKIFDAVKSFNGKVVMTSSDLRSGTDRIAQAADILDLGSQDIIVNIQGDQPVFNSKVLDQLVLPFEQDKHITMTTLACKITDKKQITEPKHVKVLFDNNNFAIYFSRAQIPFSRDNDTPVDYYKHLGFYAYKKRFLDIISNLESGRYENIEKLEQLRVLEAGYKIKVSITKDDAPGVDVPEDIKIIEQYLIKM